jgi:hypothetical protein
MGAGSSRRRAPQNKTITQQTASEISPRGKFLPAIKFHTAINEGMFL